MTQETDGEGVWDVQGNVRILLKPSEAYLKRLEAQIPIPPKPRTVQEIQASLEKGEHVTHEELERLVFSLLRDKS